MSVLFLSYSSSDAINARRLKQLLETAGYRAVFRDRDEREGIPGGTPWVNELLSNLERSEVVIFMATTDSLASVWCHTEIAVAVARGKHVVQVSTSKVPIHPLLAQVQGLVAPSIDALVDVLVRDLSRVGHPPGDPFAWDPGSSPYPGLDRLTERHAAVLFGRDREITAVLDRLALPEPDPVLIIGSSGSGKSSLVRAGVIPRLALQPSTILLPVVEPGAHGLRRVLAALTADDRHAGADEGLLVAGIDGAVDRLVVRGGRAVLVLDQVEDALMDAAVEETEELFRRLRAIDRDRLAVVVILRSASIEAWMRRPELAQFAPGDPVWVRPLDRSALREVITGPARLAGIRFEPPELVDRILDDTGQGQALPLLAALLEELTRDHSRLAPSSITTAKYETVGPVTRVVDRRAGAATAELSRRYEISEEAAVRAYLRLVDIDDQGRSTRSELAVDGLTEEETRVFEVLERNRLVIRDNRIAADSWSSQGAGSAGVTVDESAMHEILVPPHEEVFRAWPALAGAIQAQRHDLEVRTMLRRDASAWANSGKGSVSLTGGRLEVAIDWYERHRAESADSQIGEYVRTAVRQRSRRRLLMIAAPALAVVLAVISVLAVRLAIEAGRADRARDEAEALRLAGASSSMLGSRLDLGLLLALEAAARSEDIQVDAAPLVGLTRGAGPTAFFQLGGPVDKGAVSQAGSRAVLTGSAGISMWDVHAEQEVATVPGDADAVAINSDGSTVAIANGEQLDLRSWETPASVAITCPTPGGLTELVRFARDSGLLQVVAVDRSAVPPTSVVSILDPTDCRQVTSHSVEALAVDVDLSDDLLIVALEDGGLELVELSSGSSTLLVPPGQGAVRAVALDGYRLAAATEQGDLWLWDARLPAPPRQLAVESVAIVDVAFTGDGGSIVTTDVEGNLRVVSPESDPPVGPALASLPRLGYSGPVGAVDLTVVELTATTLDPSGRVTTWDLTGRWATGEQPLAAGRFDALAPLSDGSLVAAGPAGFWTTSDGERASPAPEFGITGLSALVGSGTGWVAGTREGAVIRGETADQSTPRTVLQLDSEIRGVGELDDGSIAAVTVEGTLAFENAAGVLSTVRIDDEPRAMAVNGRFVLVGTRSGAVLVFDTRQLTQDPLRVVAHRADAATVVADLAGEFVATGGDDRAIVVWRQDGDGQLSVQYRLAGHTDRVTSLAFSPDGRWLASAGEDRTVILWDLERGEQVGEPMPLAVTPRLAFATTGPPMLHLAGDGWERLSVRPQDWIDRACSIIGARRFDDVERQRFLRGAEPAAPCIAAAS